MDLVLRKFSQPHSASCCNMFIIINTIFFLIKPQFCLHLLVLCVTYHTVNLTRFLVLDFREIHTQNVYVECTLTEI